MLFFFSSVIALLSAEAALQLAGYQPWKANINGNRQKFHESHPVLGWRSMEGSYLLPPYHPSGTDIHYTFLANGMRKSHESQNNSRDDRPKLLLLGGSYTQGWAISDDETYAWKLQERFPFVEVMNYGVGGYGTYQSLLVLEKVLPSIPNPRLVIYGFIEHHESRNAGTANWMEAVLKFGRKDIFLPFVTMNTDGYLVRHPPEHLRLWPLRKKSSLVSSSQNVFMRIKAKGRAKERRRVTEQLLLETQKLCQGHGTDLFVVILASTQSTTKHYMEFLENNNIMVADCTYPLTSKMKVKGDGHPNSKQNTKWSAGIADALSKRLEL